MTNDLTIQTTFLPHTDPDTSLAFYRDVLGFEVRLDVGDGVMRWITVGPVDQPGVSIVLSPVFAHSDITDEERSAITALMGRGHFAMIVLATKDLDGTFQRLKANGGDVVQEPTTQPWGAVDCVFRDPAGNIVRINQQG